VSAPVEPGDLLDGKYRVEKVLGMGGMGVVVQAFHEKLEQRVAIKFLLPNMKENAEVVSRFSREARAAARIKNDHVARVIDVSTLPDGAPYMVMEFLEGEDLRQILRARGPFPIQLLADYILQALEALSDAHRAGVVHRDLKPANLFLARLNDDQTTIKVLDFGISKLQNDITDPSITSSVAMVGSPIYMSPEQVRLSRSVDHRADIWSIGATMYELATGVRPFPREAMAQMVSAILFDAAPPPSQVRPGIPPGFDAVILRCLQKDPSQRFADCADLALALAAFASPESAGSVQRICRMSSSTSARMTKAPEIEALLGRSDPGTGAPVQTPEAAIPVVEAGPARATVIAVGVGVVAAVVVVVVAAFGYRHFAPPAEVAAGQVDPVGRVAASPGSTAAPPPQPAASSESSAPRPPSTGAAVAAATAVPSPDTSGAAPSSAPPLELDAPASVSIPHRSVTTPRATSAAAPTGTTARPKPAASSVSGFGPRD